MSLEGRCSVCGTELEGDRCPLCQGEEDRCLICGSGLEWEGNDPLGAVLVCWRCDISYLSLDDDERLRPHPYDEERFEAKMSEKIRRLLGKSQ